MSAVAWIAVGWAGASVAFVLVGCGRAFLADRREDRARARLVALAARGHVVEGYGLGGDVAVEDTTSQVGGW